MRLTKDHGAEACGWAGIIFIQGATAPSIVGVICGWSTQLPPLSMVLMVWAGLALFLYRSWYRKSTVSIVSNGVGFILQSVMLAILSLPR